MSSHDRSEEDAYKVEAIRERFASKQAERLTYHPTLSPFRKATSPHPVKGKLWKQKPMIDSSSDYLSAHFSLYELTFSSTAIRHGIDNTPNANQILNIKSLTEVCLEPARLALGAIKVNSGFRALALNVLVKGSPTSEHMSLDDHAAADIRPLSPIVSMARLYSWLSKWVEFNQLIWEFGGSWVHVSHRRGGENKRERLVSYIRNGVVHYREVDFRDGLS